MKVGQYLLNPVIGGAAIGASIGATQKLGHDRDVDILDSAKTGATYGLGVGVAYIGARTAFASMKVGTLTNPFRSKEPSFDTSGMTAQQIAALQGWRGLMK